jgi:hypothetical protein
LRIFLKGKGTQKTSCLELENSFPTVPKNGKAHHLTKSREKKNVKTTRPKRALEPAPFAKGLLLNPPKAFRAKTGETAVNSQFGKKLPARKSQKIKQRRFLKMEKVLLSKALNPRLGKNLTPVW